MYVYIYIYIYDIILWSGAQDAERSLKKGKINGKDDNG